VITFHLVVFGWILFRAQSLDQAQTMISRLFAPGSATLWSVPVIAAVVVVIGLQLLPSRGVEGFQVRLERLRPVVIAVGLAILILYVGATVPSQGVAPFIYFRF
jgi:ethanolamine transporter EutH